MPIAGDINVTPDISFSVEPCEDGKVVYMRVIPPTRGATSNGMLYLFLKITTKAKAKLLAIDISFPGSEHKAFSFARELELEGTSTLELEASEVMRLSGSPTNITVSLRFASIAEPVTRTWPLAPHAVEYRFPFRAADGPQHGEYLVLNGGHLGGKGSQVFAQDVHAVSWRGGTLSDRGASDGANTDLLVFERPVHAMADGVVVYADDSNEDNPLGKKNIRRMAGHWDGKGKVKDLAVACLPGSKYRIVVASVSEQDHLTLTALEQTAYADKVTESSERAGPAATKVTITELDSEYFVTTTLLGTIARTTLWRLDAAGGITEQGHDESTGVASVRLLRLSDDILVRAQRTTGGALTLVVERRVGAALGGYGATNFAGVGADFEMLAISETSFVTAVQVGGKLKVIAWRLDSLGGGDSVNGPLERFQVLQTDTYDAGAVSEIAAVPLIKDLPHFGFAVRAADQTMKLIVFELVDGAIVRKADRTGGPAPAAMLRGGTFKRESVLVMTLTSANMLHLTMLNIEVDPDTNKVAIANDSDEVETGPTDLYCAASMPTAQTTMVTVVRTASGLARLILWQLTGSNELRILHGEEIVTFSHLKQGSFKGKFKSLPAAVQAGQYLAQAGNSGAAAGPHLHMQADRVRDGYLGPANVDKLVEYIRLHRSIGAITVPRPMQFTGASAMIVEKVTQPGPNPFGEVDGFGAYFNAYCVLPSS